MKFIKCPRCDLNYIQVGEKLCKVCQQELKGSKQTDEIEYCSICNASPALPGRDVCLSCLRDLTRENIDTDNDEPSAAQAISISGSSAVEAMIPQIQDDDIEDKMPVLPELEDMPESMEEELSLECVIEDEEDAEFEDEDSYEE